MASLGDFVVATILLSWLVASVFAQPRPSRVLASRWYDFNGLLPNYRFFAPRPIAYDYIIEYRFGRGEQPSVWRSLPIEEKNGMCWVWNPSQRLRKGVNDLVALLLRARADDSILVSHPYVAILNVATALAAAEGGIAVQFRVVRSGGHSCTREIIFRSQAHSVE
jgi:hypothetical protein